MNNLIFGLVVLGGAAVGFIGLFTGSKISAMRAQKKIERENKAKWEQLNKESDRRKKANEQKESMETGSGVSDFNASIAAIDELRNNRSKQ